jgi:hypothetical protein
MLIGMAVIGASAAAQTSPILLEPTGGSGYWFWIDNPNGTYLRFSNGSSAGANQGGPPVVITSSGSVGIGTTSPQATLDVGGSLHVANPSMVSGLMLNNSFVQGSGPTAYYYKIATLAPDNSTAYGHLHLLVTTNPDWYAPANNYMDVVFANRAGFVYQYTLRGAQVSNAAKLVAYKNGDSSIDIYLTFGANSYTTASYTVVENIQQTVYASPANVGATPSGTLVFDSSSSSYPPSTYADFSGNLTVQGNLSLSSTSGAHITFADGTVQSTAYTGVTCGGDYAESVDVTGDRTNYEPGDVLVIDPAAPGRFLKANEAYSTMVAGIYSTKPGVVGRRQTTDPKTSTTEVPMAMVGIVPTKVSAENGPIKIGDLLVASSTLGRAMKGTDRSQLTGTVIGKALGALDSGTGVIEVLVTLQ